MYKMKNYKFLKNIIEKIPIDGELFATVLHLNPTAVEVFPIVRVGTFGTAAAIIELILWRVGKIGTVVATVLFLRLAVDRTVCFWVEPVDAVRRTTGKALLNEDDLVEFVALVFWDVILLLLFLGLLKKLLLRKGGSMDFEALDFGVSSSSIPKLCIINKIQFFLFISLNRIVWSLPLIEEFDGNVFIM